MSLTLVGGTLLLLHHFLGDMLLLLHLRLRPLSSCTRLRWSRTRFTTSRRKSSFSRIQPATQACISSHETSSSSTVHALPPSPVSTDIAVAGSRPVFIWNDIVSMRSRYAELRAHCTAPSANGHSLGSGRLSLRTARNVFTTSRFIRSTVPCDHEAFATLKWRTTPNREDTICIIYPVTYVLPSLVNALGTPNEAHHFSTERAAASIEHDTASSRQTNRLTSSINTSTCL